MNTTKSHTKWLGGLAFESTNPGGTITIDAAKEQGGSDSGLRPKALMLNSLAGCSAMDIANLVGKMRAEIDTFTIDAEGDLTDEEVQTYHTFRVTYNFFGANLDKDKLEKIVKLSTEKYCGVMTMFRQFAKIEININYLTS
ncbi:OsmC family protein [Flavobacterium tegetincola]|uniref:OsmC family protein n=1 Tax=Flavobacterium tegetincola TaxID=150172 RepID=UPI00040CC7A6|nr:OsmC family protein [Flavobacterium tegetincola]